MAINLCCQNHKCKYYFEQICEKNINEDFMVIDESGKCESFEEGKSDWYKESETEMPTHKNFIMNRFTKKN